MVSTEDLAGIYRDMEQSPDLEARVRYLSALLRVGRLTQQQLELAAYLGHEESQIVTGTMRPLPASPELIEDWIRGLKPFVNLLRNAPFVFITEEFLVRPALERGIREVLTWRAWANWDPHQWRCSRFLRGGLRSLVDKLDLPLRLLQHALLPLCLGSEFPRPIHVFEESMVRNIHGTQLELVVGDLTLIHSDIIVNSASRNLAHIYGGFVNNTIHRAGGDEIRKECEGLGHCDTGEAKRSGPGRFFVKSIIHAVAPSPSFDNQDDESLLAQAHESCLKLANEEKARSIAFPALGCGARGFPVHEAATIAMNSVVQFLKKNGKPERVLYCLTSKDDYLAFEKALDRIP